MGSEIEVELPVEGSWTVLNPPGHGQWQFDLVGAGPDGRHLGTGWWRAAVGLAEAQQANGWSRPVKSPIDGEVVTAHDGKPDRRKLCLPAAFVASFLVRPLRHRDDPPAMAGNHVVVAGPRGAAFLAHLRQGSLRVRPGDRVRAGQVVGEVGNSGNTVMPHLHVHMLDGPDLVAARTIPFVVRGYEQWDGARWVMREGAALPTTRSRIRGAVLAS